MSTSPKPTPPGPSTKSSVIATGGKNENNKAHSPTQSVTEKTQLPGPLPSSSPSGQAAQSLKDLLLSARIISRGSSGAQSPAQPPPTETESASLQTTVEHSLETVISGAPKDEGSILVNTSDGDSSHPAQPPSDPVSQDLSPSPMSNAFEDSQEKYTLASQTVPQSQSGLQGLAIAYDGPSVVHLEPINSIIPNLQAVQNENEEVSLGDGIHLIANVARKFAAYDREMIGATTKYIAYALRGIYSFRLLMTIGGRVRVIDQNTGTRAIAQTPSGAAVVNVSICGLDDGTIQESEDAMLLVLDKQNDLTLWTIQPWKIDSGDIP
jgi:hypothetical protein